MENKLDAKGFKHFLEGELKGKHVLLLGFGREGQSSYKVLEGLKGLRSLGIADRYPSDTLRGINGKIKVHTGPSYLEKAGGYDYILRSPGIPASEIYQVPTACRISSQTDLFLAWFSPISIGVTGTKGKSTTAVLIRDMLKESGLHVLLAGNIGLPVFDAVSKIRGPESRVVLELSAHQLENIRRAPYIACLLNLYEEHLDHFPSREAYFAAKWRIGLLQSTADSIILNAGDERIMNSAEISVLKSNIYYYNLRKKDTATLPRPGAVFEGNGILIEGRKAFAGHHQQINALASAQAALLAGGSLPGLQTALDSFHGLPHRLEYLGEHGGVHYYNDAIATIPEAVIAALESLVKVDTLLLGGFDRNVDYEKFTVFLTNNPPKQILCSGPAGKRIFYMLRERGFSGALSYSDRFREAVRMAVETAIPGEVVLLSPAAPSYDEFSNFTEKGELFRKETGKP